MIEIIEKINYLLDELEDSAPEGEDLELELDYSEVRGKKMEYKLKAKLKREIR